MVETTRRNTFMGRNKFMGRLALVTSLAAVLAFNLTGPASAQAEAAADAESDTELVIPENVTLLGQNDPNVRHATAIVNGAVITGTDIDQRLALILAANNQPISAEEKSRLRLQILRNLIDETLQIQAAKEQTIEIPQEEIDQTYARVATQNFGQDTKKMDEYLEKIGSSAASLKRQIHGELAWQRLVRRNVEPFINVSEEEVRELIGRLEASKGTAEYRLGEIYLAAPAENKAPVYENARQIVEQLRQGGSFVAYARQYSQASTAAVGGDLGWVRLPQLPDDLANVARDMQPGQLVGPVEVPGGFSILYMIDKRQVLMADPRDALLSLKQISLELPAGMPDAQAKQRIAGFAEAVKQIRGCGEADEKAAAIGANVVANDDIRARDLPKALQDSLLSLSVGETTPPFGSVNEGVRVLMLCGRDDPSGANTPNFDQVMAQIEDDRVGKRAQRYLRDLRRDAVIDYN